MKSKEQYIVYGLFFIFFIVIAYMGRAVLAPFVLAAIFAYILNPLVDLLAHKLKLPRGVSVGIIYVVLIGIISIAAFNIGIRISEETAEFSHEAKILMTETTTQISNLPEWLRPISVDIFESIRSYLVPNRKLVTYIPGALNRTLGVLIFLTASFYFLKDGKNFKNSFFSLLPDNARSEVEIIVGKINRVLGDYLRGQLLLVVIMSTLTYIGLLIIGVRYGLILSIFTGLAEIIPFVGPIVAGAVAVLVAATDQYSRLSSVNPMLDVVAVASLYTVLRQLEDLFIIPQVMGRMTKLHPLVVLFSVLIGGHIFGIPGYLVAVPFTASLKVIFDHVSGLLESHKKTPESE